MPVTVVITKFEGECLFSPFSGQAADSDDGPNESDGTLLFVYYGDMGDYAYVSPRLVDELGEDVEELEPEEIASDLSLEGAIIMEVDTGWNGVNYYGFAPVKE